MSKIKVRAWDGSNMLQDPKIGYTEGKYNYSINDELSDSDYIYMLFTGLLDKNGKEIYEGDIVYNSYAFRNCAVEWLFGMFATDDGDSLDFRDSKSYEVIGNIYENAELLR